MFEACRILPFIESPCPSLLRSSSCTGRLLLLRQAARRIKERAAYGIGNRVDTSPITWLPWRNRSVPLKEPAAWRAAGVQKVGQYLLTQIVRADSLS